MSHANNDDHGFKKLTADNWQRSDETTELWRKVTAFAETEDEWAANLLAPTLDSKVPPEIGKLLEVARGAMMYSWYYYPLATLGMEQCYRVMEAGVRLRCELAGIPTRRITAGGKEWLNSFEENISALKSGNIIPSGDGTKWEAMRNLRNSASHPELRQVFDPGQAEGMLSSIVEDLNALFC
jgi:hypothetical protein